MKGRRLHIIEAFLKGAFSVLGRMNYRVDCDLPIPLLCQRTHFFETFSLFLWSLSLTSAFQIFGLAHLLRVFIPEMFTYNLYKD